MTATDRRSPSTTSGDRDTDLTQAAASAEMARPDTTDDDPSPQIPPSPDDHTEQTDGSESTDHGDGDSDSARRTRWRRRALPRLRQRVSLTPLQAALLFGLTALAAVAGLLGWLGVGLHRQHVADQHYAMYLQAGRQGALNLTTIDWQHADADVARILDSATGAFHDDFSSRAKDFIDIVKQTQSRSEGSIADAGVEIETPTGAQILVAVNVKSTQAGQPDERSRGWRMRLDVERVGDTAKIANVEFVP